MLRILSGVYLGWGLGANDAANVFGTGVAAGVVKYRTAIVLTSLFVIIGALAQGSRGMHTVGALTDVDVHTAFIASTAAAITITILTILAIPVSTSQAIVGAILAVGVTGGGVKISILVKILLSWIISPFAALLISYILYRVVGSLIERRIRDVHAWSVFMKIGFYLVGIYGAYALGANNVANTTGVFLRAGMLTPFTASLIGSVSIGIGVCTFSRRVMYTVGKKITELSEFAALVAVLGQDITVHLFSWVGVPVSTSQAIVGAVIGVGLVKPSGSVNFGTVGRIVMGWFSTPAAAFIMTYGILKIGAAVSM
jgi:PiT family inorganic phosphate transporter